VDAAHASNVAKLFNRIEYTRASILWTQSCTNPYTRAVVNQEQKEYLQQSIRTIADYPKPGIQFRDITTLLRDHRAFKITIEALCEPWSGRKIDKVAGIEARGFILGGAVAHHLGAGFVPIRKRGKLPHEIVRVAYSLEYGVDEMEMHKDAVRSNEHVLLVDDLIATGGTAMAASQLLASAGVQVLASCFVIDLPLLGGAKKLAESGIQVQSLLTF
jgi:adenine phosphoribosyltransferase